MKLRTPSGIIPITRPLLMGIVNLNDDSFCDDGTLDPKESIQQARQLIKDGADIIDIGAESARTNRGPILITEEIRRLRAFLELWPEIRDVDSSRSSPVLLSANTWRTEVIEEIIDEIDILNDLSALPDDSHAKLCAAHGVALLIMHTVGQPKVPHTDKTWSNLIPEMLTFFREKSDLALNSGLEADQIILDPGLDFAKQCEDNLLVLRELSKFAEFGFPMLLPISRKTLIGEALDLPNPTDRDPGTLALLTQGMMAGASIFRIHNVKAAAEARAVLEPLAPPQLHVMVNFAISADGKIGNGTGSASKFTSENDLKRLLEIRKKADAILVGRGTLEADDMTLSVDDHDLWRCVISRSGKFDPGHKFFRTEGGPRHLVVDPGVKIDSSAFAAEIHRTNLEGWLKILRNEPSVKTLLCEGGGSLAAELFRLDLVDEIHLTWAGHSVIGGQFSPTITGVPGEFLPSSRNYQLRKLEKGDENEFYLNYHKIPADAS